MIQARNSSIIQLEELNVLWKHNVKALNTCLIKLSKVSNLNFNLKFDSWDRYSRYLYTSINVVLWPLALPFKSSQKLLSVAWNYIWSKATLLTGVTWDWLRCSEMFSTFSALLSQLFFFISCKLSSIRKMIFSLPNPWVRPYFMAVFSISEQCKILMFHDFFFACLVFSQIGEWGLNWETFCVTFYAASKISLAFTNSLLNLTEYCLALLKSFYFTLYLTIYYNILFLPLPYAALITTASWCLMFFLNTYVSYWWLSLSLSLFQGLVFSFCPVQMESRSVSCLTASSGASPPAGPLTACDLLFQVITHTSAYKIFHKMHIEYDHKHKYVQYKEDY